MARYSGATLRRDDIVSKISCWNSFRISIWPFNLLHCVRRLPSWRNSTIFIIRHETGEGPPRWGCGRCQRNLLAAARELAESKRCFNGFSFSNNEETAVARRHRRTIASPILIRQMQFNATPLNASYLSIKPVAVFWFVEWNVRWMETRWQRNKLCTLVRKSRKLPVWHFCSTISCFELPGFLKKVFKEKKPLFLCNPSIFALLRTPV